MADVQQSSTGLQSRVGKRPVALPQGVQVTIKDGLVSVKGSKGAIERRLPPSVDVQQKDGKLVVVRAKKAGADFPMFQGLARAILRNMVEGVSKGYALSMDLYGTGYRAEVSGQNLTLALGLSHPVKLTLPQPVQARVETIDEAGQKRPRLHLTSHDKELLGQTAAKIRSFRPPEPYKGKGVRYTNEKIREKAGKAAAKGSKK